MEKLLFHCNQRTVWKLNLLIKLVSWSRIGFPVRAGVVILLL